MTEHFEPARTAGSATPVLVVVDADRQARIATEAALVRRFKPDYCQAVTRAVIIATGVTYRRLDIPGLDRFVSTGVFYGAAGVEAPAMAGQEVYVIGGANLAGQAALHLARFAARVTLLVRGQSLETSVPGVFAAGDVRFGSVKRVAGAVGEGSVTVGSVHRYLADGA